MRNRPRAEVSYSLRDWLAELLALAELLVAIVVVVAAWPGLSASIPSHFNAAGRPDAWSGKGILIAMPGVTAGLYALLTIASRFPRSFNVPWPITEANAQRQYAYAVSLLVWLKAEVTWMGAYLAFGIIRTAQGHAGGLSSWFLPLFLVVLFGTIGIYLYAAGRAQ